MLVGTEEQANRRLKELDKIKNKAKGFSLYQVLFDLTGVTLDLPIARSHLQLEAKILFSRSSKEFTWPLLAFVS